MFKCPKIVKKNCPKLSKIAKNCPKFSKIIQNCPKLSKLSNIPQNCPKLPKIERLPQQLYFPHCDYYYYYTTQWYSSAEEQPLGGKLAYFQGHQQSLVVYQQYIWSNIAATAFAEGFSLASLVFWCLLFPYIIQVLSTSFSRRFFLLSN